MHSRPNITGKFGHLLVKDVYTRERSAPIASISSNGSKLRVSNVSTLLEIATLCGCVSHSLMMRVADAYIGRRHMLEKLSIDFR